MMVISIILGLVISAILIPPFLDLTDKIQDHLLEKKLHRQMLKRIKGGSKMNDRVDELYIKMASLYSKQSDVGLCGAEEQELWELEQEYKKFIDLNK